MVEFAKLLLPATVIAVGWVVVYRLQALQSRRKTLREQVEVARGQLKQVRALAIAFHTAGSFDEQQHDELLELIADVDRLCGLFPKIVCTRAFLPNAADPATCTVPGASMMALRQAVTLEHFDPDPWREALPRDAVQIADIRLATTRLLAELDRIAVAALD